MMTIYPYVGIDNLKFTDSLRTIKEKLAKFRNVVEGTAVELDKKYPSLTVEGGILYIVFYHATERVRYFQVSVSITHEGNDLHKLPIEKLTSIYKKLDPNLSIEFDGFDSRAFGLTVNASEEEGLNDVLVYGADYAAEAPVTPDDILKYYGS